MLDIDVIPWGSVAAKVRKPSPQKRYWGDKNVHCQHGILPLRKKRRKEKETNIFLHYWEWWQMWNFVADPLLSTIQNKRIIIQKVLSRKSRCKNTFIRLPGSLFSLLKTISVASCCVMCDALMLYIQNRKGKTRLETGARWPTAVPVLWEYK